jgi:hypothetical protein
VSLTFNGIDFYDGGTGYTFTPSSFLASVKEVSPDIGVGYFLKPGNTEPINHEYSIRWRVATPGTVKAVIESLTGRATLVDPLWGSFPGCRLHNIGSWKAKKSGELYLVSNTLTFRQYPTGA